MHVIINIGRNIGTTPMSEGEWNMFRAGVRASIRIHTRGEFGGMLEFAGVGEWETVQEESASIQAFDVKELDAAGLRGTLARLAKDYRQDAIALTIAGGSELIEP